MAEKPESDKNEERRKRVFVGKLPADFLRLPKPEMQSTRKQQEAADAQAAIALQHQLGLPHTCHAIGRLNITVAQAKLVKNYGLTRMDPYVTLRVGHCVYETPADMNGGKNPKWNKVIHCRLPQGINTIHVKIYDECSLKVDELIAWTEITIPQNVLNGETCDDWFPLSGKQGERVEGMINLVISFTPSPYGPYSLNSVLMGVPPAPYTYSSNMRRPPISLASASYPGRSYQLPGQDLKHIEEMFPNMDKDVVRSVYEANGGNKDLTVNSLLQMSF